MEEKNWQKIYYLFDVIKIVTNPVSCLFHDIDQYQLGWASVW